MFNISQDTFPFQTSRLHSPTSYLHRTWFSRRKMNLFALKSLQNINVWQMCALFIISMFHQVEMLFHTLVTVVINDSVYYYMIFYSVTTLPWKIVTIATYLSWIILKHDNPKIQSPNNGIVLAYKRFHIFYANPLYFELSSPKKAMFFPWPVK